MLSEELIQTIEDRKAAELRINLAKKEFEESIAVDKAILEDLKEKEEQQRLEYLEYMKEQGLDKQEINGHNIIKNVRITNTIKDVGLFATAVAKNMGKINAFGVPVELITDLFATEQVITNKKLATDIINNFEKVEDILLDGCEKKITEFLTIS